jgi:ATP-dependent DNA helicase RecG
MKVMRQELQQAGLSVPTFESNRENDTFSVTFLFHHLLDKDAWAWLGKYKELNLTEDQMSALVFVRETGQISNLAFRDSTGLDTLYASSSLRRLRQMGLLDKIGSGAATFYIGSEKLTGDIVEMTENTLPTGRAGLHVKGGSLQDTASRLQGRTSVSVERFSIPLRKRLMEFQFGRRAEPDAIRSLIIEICRSGPISKEELALHLSRDATYLAQSFLSPLVKEGAIALAIPDSPNHPEQKYTVKMAKKNDK